MRRVLVISYFMPPIAGPGGVNRTCRFLRYLPEHGYEPIILTASAMEAASAWAPIWDDRRVACRVERVDRVNSSRPRTRLGRIRDRLCALPDPQVGWANLAYPIAAELIRREQPDLLLTTSPPFSVAMLGARLRRELGIPWVCDLRDPWTDYFLGTWPTRLHHWLCCQMERNTLAAADAVIAITPGHRKIMERRWPRLRGRITTITNGFDDECLNRNYAAQRRTDRIDIVYAGSFCGSSDPTDHPSVGQRLFSYRPRSFQSDGHTARYLLQAMALFLDGSPRWQGRVRLTHLGVPDRSAARYAARLGIPEAYHPLGYVSSWESARLQADASALFLCLAHSHAGEQNDCVPQKTYEYLAAGPPILAAVSAGDARSLLLSAGHDLVCYTTDVPALASAIGRLAEIAEGRRPSPVPDWEFIAQFRASNLTARLAAVFHAVLNGAATLDELGEFPRHDASSLRTTSAVVPHAAVA